MSFALRKTFRVAKAFCSTFCPFFVFLYVKYLCLPERRLVIGYIYKKEDCDCELDGRFADDYADEIKTMFDAYTASDDTPKDVLRNTDQGMGGM